MNNTSFSCPYCFSQKTNKGVLFHSWKSVSAHTKKCKNKPEKLYFYIDHIIGPIHVKLFEGSYSGPKIASILKGLITRPSDIRKEFKRRGFELPEGSPSYYAIELLFFIRKFNSEYGRIPGAEDFKENTEYPSPTTYEKEYGSWNNAIKAAGFEPNITSYGIPTKALDGITYKSRPEAEFVNTYLYNKFIYYYEPRYIGKLWKYDFYLPQLDLYIELTQYINPERIEEKIKYHKENNINCKVIYTLDIHKEEFKRVWEQYTKVPNL